MKPANYDMKFLLKQLKKDCKKNKVTNLSAWFGSWQTDHHVATILTELNLVAKNNLGFYKWITTEPTRKMAMFVRETTNQVKNYAQ